MPSLWYGAAALLLALTPTPAPTRPVSPTPARAVTCDPEPGVAEVTGTPWPQERLRFSQVWRLTRGEGVRVAVVDSGVDAAHPQLRGVVTDQVDLTGTDARDCVGHGTAVAGIIAGQDLTSRGVPVLGVAPAAKILAIKQSAGRSGDVSRLAAAIRRAADLGADVINVSVQAHDAPELKAAVAYAQEQDAVIVAAAGNVEQDGGEVTPAYPAEYPGVIAVGAASPDGDKPDFSNGATRVSVTAPGAGITSAWTGGGYRTGLDGTSFAAPFVSGVAALVRARYPDLDHWQVKRRIEQTAEGGERRAPAPDSSTRCRRSPRCCRRPTAPPRRVPPPRRRSCCPRRPSRTRARVRSPSASPPARRASPRSWCSWRSCCPGPGAEAGARAAPRHLQES
ncbi:S8 family serine peptidase [Nonomuraea sp. N2-4H]|uniref:S8 family serine peptidase n=1 Tax=Nonomuraea sp. N2-4H TaxID=3128898 RepID=UPI0032557D37